MAGYGLVTDAKFKGFTTAGAPLVGGLLYTYEPGTTTNKTTYKTPGGTANTNPVVLDSRGEGDVWLDGETKLVLKTSAGVTIWTVDNVPGIGNTFFDPITDYNTNLTDAVSTIGATSGTLYIDRAITVSANTSVPETLNLLFTRGGSLSIDAGKTVTLAGQVTAGNWAVFSGSGSVSGIGAKNDPVEATWFGTTAAAVNKAISAIGSTETSLNFDGTFTIDADVTIASTTTTTFGRKATFTISAGKTLTIGGPIDYEASPIQNIIQSGLIVRPNGPADMAGDIDAGIAWDSKGHKITVGSSQAVDFSTDRDAGATVPGAGLQRYITVIARIAREWHGAITYDPVTGTNRQPSGGTQFVLEVVSGTAAASSPARYTPAWDEVILCDVLLTSSTTAVTWDMIDDTRAPYISTHRKIDFLVGDSALPTTNLEQYGFYAVTSYNGGSQPQFFAYNPNDSTYWPIGPIYGGSTTPTSAYPNGGMRVDPDTGWAYVKRGGSEQVIRAPLRYEDLTSYYVICSGVSNTSYASAGLAATLHTDVKGIEVAYIIWTGGTNVTLNLKTSDTNTDRVLKVSGADEYRGTVFLPIGSNGTDLYHKNTGANQFHTLWIVGEWRN